MEQVVKSLLFLEAMLHILQVHHYAEMQEIGVDLKEELREMM